MLSRRDFLQKGVALGAGFSVINDLSALSGFARSDMKLGLVTYEWGKDWDLPTVIANCTRTGLLGVELRAEHAHGVEVSLNASQRAEVKKRFADSPVTCVGYGSDFEYQSPDPKILRQNIEQTKEHIKLCKDIGATGIKVKPNGLPSGVPREKTIAQIAASLNEVGRFAKDYGQQVRVEAHGPGTQQLPTLKAIFDQVTERSVKLCWNSNDTDIQDPGVEGNFKLVKKWIADTVHVRGFDKVNNKVNYPYQQLFNLLAGVNFKGWILIESSTEPADKIAVMKEQLSLFNQLVANIRKA